MNNSEIPKWNQLFMPTLKAYSDGEPHVNRSVKVIVADSLELPDELRNERTAVHKENKIEGRVGWAISALKIAGLLENHSRGSNIITHAGKTLLQSPPADLNEKYLEENYPSYLQNKQENLLRYREKKLHNDYADQSTLIEDYTPEEAISKSVSTLEKQLSDELLNKLRNIDPYRFEQIVADLLTAMGYGELTVTQKSSDGGIDAIVNEDKLGLDKILVQAKRYAADNIVNELAIRNFAGALATRNINKGIVATTSSFSPKAIDSVSGMQIRLINGNELAQLMLENNIGASVENTYYIRRLDSDYFDE